MKRGSLKKGLLTLIIAFVAVIIFVITAVNIKIQSDKIKELTESVLAKESVSYASEVYNWWSAVEERVDQTANVYRSIPSLTYDDTREMLLKLTAADPDSQDVYIAFGNNGVFLDGSGWIPDESFVFTDRAWYTGALKKNGGIYTSEPYVDVSTGKTCLACSVMIRDKVVLSSDISFDKVAEKLESFSSSSEEALFYIVNKETKDILVASKGDITGQIVGECDDAVIQGLAKVIDGLNTENSISVSKVKTASTSVGKMMYAATDIRETSWIVVSAVPYTFVSSSIISNVILTFVISAVLLILLAAALYFVISKYINPVTKVSDRIGDISRGDFTVTLVPEGNNEITTLSERLNEYIEDMSKILRNMNSISDNMNASAGECLDISHTLASSNQSQGVSIEKLNTALNAMNDSIEEIAHAATDLAGTSGKLSVSAAEIKDICNETMDSSAAGRNEMANMTRNVGTLNDTIRDLTEIIRVTARSVEEITGITDTINAISSQTNLLSLNASIEAARAGEMGRGFAVVASEVGALAKQSSEATDTIRKLIDGITGNIEDINKKADHCVRDMEACLTGVDSANKSFEQIYDDLSKATEGIISITNDIERINEVATSNAATTEEQASTINEIISLSDMIVTESNRLVKETGSISSISEDLNRYSEAMRNDLSQYRLNGQS